MAGGKREAGQGVVRTFAGGDGAAAGNPYVSGNSVGGSAAFVGREDVVRAVVNALSEQKNQGIVLYGQRRIGKTSILQHLLTALPERMGHRPVYFDLQDKAADSLSAVLEELTLDIAAAIDKPAPEPGGDVEAWFRDSWLPEILAGLAPGASLVLLFDEFDVLADVQAKQAASALFPYLRRLLEQNVPRLRVIFVIGRNIDDLENVTHSLFKGIPSHQVSLLSREDAERLIRLSESNGTLRWTDEAVAAAWNLTHGHPLLLQSLCSNAWTRAHEGRRGVDVRAILPADVTAAAELTLGSTRNAFEWLWKGLPPGKRVVAAALAHAGPEAISEDGLHKILQENGVRVIIRELREAPRMLIEWDLLEEPVQGQYRFRVELLRRLIARYKPLVSAQEDLDKIDPAAEALYKAGEALYGKGNLDSAMGRLQEALGINPNHWRASELLADILISRKAWPEARAVLERLYQDQPAMARARLVQVLLEQAREPGRSGAEEFALYEYAHRLDKNSATAAEGIRRIWKDRGDAARAADDLEGARKAYSAGGLDDLAAEVATELRRARAKAGLSEVTALERQGAYSAALARVRRLAEEYGDGDWEPEIGRIRQAISLEGLNEVRRLEHAEAYAAALERARLLEQEYGDVWDWKSELDRIVERANLDEAYRGAIQGGIAEAEMKKRLARVVGRDPEFKDALQRLYTLVLGDRLDAADREKERAALADDGRSVRNLAVAQVCLVFLWGMLTISLRSPSRLVGYWMQDIRPVEDGDKATYAWVLTAVAYLCVAVAAAAPAHRIFRRLYKGDAIWPVALSFVLAVVSLACFGMPFLIVGRRAIGRASAQAEAQD